MTAEEAGAAEASDPYRPTQSRSSTRT